MAKSDPDKKLLLPFYKRRTLSKLRGTAEQPEAGMLEYGGGGAALGLPIGALSGMALGHKMMPGAAIGGAVGALGGGVLGLLTAAMRNKERAQAQETLKLPKRELTRYLHDAAIQKYLNEMYGLQRAGRSSVNTYVSQSNR